MPVRLDEFKDADLPAAVDDNEYRLARAALEWRLSAPITIRSAEDILSKAAWGDRVEPFKHQIRNLATFCRMAPAAILADEVGLGKTISAGLILSELLARRRVVRALIVCPRVLCDQWKAELENKFRITSNVSTGVQFRYALDDEKTSVLITTYETMASYMDDVPTDAFGMLILDEAHRVRNLYGAPRPPKSAAAIRDAVATRRFNYLLMLTATPIQNRFWDVYSLIDLLSAAKGHMNPLGTPAEFRSHYLAEAGGRRLKPNAAEIFRTVLRDTMARTRRADADLPFPTRDVRLVSVNLTAAERGLEELVGGVFARELNALLQSSVGEAWMSSPAALAKQLERMTETLPGLAGAVAAARAVAASPAPPAKLQRLLQFAEELKTSRPNDWRLVVFTGRTETQALIRNVFTDRGMTVGLVAGGRAKANRDDIRDFSADPPLLHVLVSTDAGAEGVNLQAANVLVNYDLPWNPMRLEQRIGRVQRLGSRHEHVTVMNLVAAGTIEEKVVGRLLEKLAAITDTIGDIESVLESLAGGADDGADERFEDVVRDLVVKSLRGQDVERQTAIVTKNIEDAKADYVKRHDEMDRNLGDLDALHNGGPQPPQLTPPRPSLAADEFVIRAWKAEGRPVRMLGPGLYEDGGKRVALSADAAERGEESGRVILCVPGQPPFDRLAEKWTGKAAHRVADLTPATVDSAGAVARTWLASYPGTEFLSATVRSPRPYVSGSVLVLLTAKNGVDQYQRLAEYPVGPERHSTIPESAVRSSGTISDRVSLQGVSSKSGDTVRRRAEADPDLVKFHGYYDARRVNDLSKAGGNPHHRKKIEDDFTVRTTAEVVGFAGARYEEALIDVTFLVDGIEYCATLQAIPVSGQLLERPSENRCAESGLTMPYGVLDRCDRTNRLVPKHRLTTSEFSGRKAERRFAAACGVTGRAALDDEVETSAVSGTIAHRDHFVTCTVTNHRVLKSEAGVSDLSGRTVRADALRPSDKPPRRRGAPDELGVCEVTGATLLRDELGVSDASGRQVEISLLVPSDVSARRALADELYICQKTNAKALPDELGRCVVTGLRVNKNLLTRSAVTGAEAQISEMEACAVSGSLVLPGELSECERTRVWVLPSLLGVCAATGTKALEATLVRCELSGQFFQPEYTAECAVSKKTVDARLLQASDLPPHRKALAHDLVRCEQSGRTLLRTEAVLSSVSGKTIGRDVAVQCEVSGARAMSAELEGCGLTQKRVVPALLGTCAATGIRALKDRLAICAETHELFLSDLLGIRAFTGRGVDARLLAASDLPPHRSGLKADFGTCTKTGRKLLKDELAPSAVTGRPIGKDLLVKSAASDRYALPEETVRCEESGQRLLPDEVGKCAETGRVVGRQFLTAVGDPTRVVLQRLAGKCGVSHGTVLLTDLETCRDTGTVALRSYMQTCAVSGNRVLRSRMVRSEVSGRWAAPAHARKSAASGQWVLTDEIAVCPWSGAEVLPSELKRCDLTRLRVLPKHLNAYGQLQVLADLLDQKVTYSKRAVDPEELGRRLLKALKPNTPELVGAIEAVAVASPADNAAAFRARREIKGWFRTQNEVIGFIVRLGTKPEIVGQGVRGRWGDDGEFEIQDAIFSKK